jgi:ABC-type multidrug transport system ATPase subunit
VSESNYHSVLQTTNLAVGYTNWKKGFSLFDNLNLNLNQGELVCFMGSNGIGKDNIN